VYALTVFDDGTGPALYAGGVFTTAGDIAASNIARWDGTSWSSLESGVSGSAGFVGSLAVFDDGTGPALYAGGRFDTAGDVTVSNIARWDGTSWTPLGAGVNRGVRALTVFDDGTGRALYAGGDFDTAGDVTASSIARWDGTAWSPLGSGMGIGFGQPFVRALTVFDDGTAPALYAGGVFTTAGDVAASSIARWDGTSWSALESGVIGTVAALVVFDDGAGPALYAGGNFNSAGNVATNDIARWDGEAWHDLGIGTSGWIGAIAVHSGGMGTGLFAGGWFAFVDGVVAGNIATWGCLTPAGQY